MRRLALIATVPFVPLLLTAQDSDEDEDDEEVYELSPFTVEGEDDQGYYSSQTMAGGRLKTELKGVATSVQVVTEQFIEDIGATTLDEILAYTTGTEAVGTMNDYFQLEGGQSGGTIDQSEARQNPEAALRIRGLAAPTRTTNYFESAAGFNSYISDRVDINRGANSFLFGLGSPGGIVNVSLQSANLNNDSVKISHRYASENFEASGSHQVSANMNKVLFEDKLALRVAALEAENNFKQKPAMKDESRRYFAIKYKPFAERNLNIRVNYEAGNSQSIPVDRLSPLETLSTFLDDPLGVVWDSSLDGQITNAAGRRISDPFNTLYTAPSDYSGIFTGVDINGDPIPYRSHLHRNGWIALFDGSAGRTDGLADRGVHAGWFNGVSGPNYDPNGHGKVQESTLQKNVSLVNSNLPEHEGFGAQGLVDYDVFDFSRHLLSGSIDYASTEFDRKMAFLDLTTKDGNFGIELGYHRETSSRDSFVGVKAPTLDIDMNYTNPAGPVDPATGYGVPNPNFGRLYVWAQTADKTVNTDSRENMRATAFARYDFADKADGFLSKLGRHNLSILFDESSVYTERFKERQRVTGNDPDFHLGEDATIFQRNAASIFYVSDPYLEAFENPNFQLSDFYTVGADPSLNMNYPLDVEIPLTFVSKGDPSLPNVAGDEFTDTGAYTPAFRSFSGILTQTDVSSQAANLQSYLLGGNLVVNLGYRQDQITELRNNEPPRYGPTDPNEAGYDPTNIEGPFEYNKLPVLTPDVFNLSNGELEVGPKVNTVGSGYVLKVPKKWLPEWLGLSAHYGASSNFSPAVGKFDFYGNTIPGASGDTKDYGITVSLMDDKLVARFNHYESKLINGQFNNVTNQAGSIVNQQGRWAKLWWHHLMDYDRNRDGIFDDPTKDDGVNPNNGSAQGIAGDGIVDTNNLAGGRQYLTLQQFNALYDAYDSWWSPWVKETENWEKTTGSEDYTVDSTFTSNPGAKDLLADTADRVSTGNELTLTWNPTRELRLSVSGSHTEVIMDNVAPGFEAMLESWVRIMEATPVHDVIGAPIGTIATNFNGNGGLTKALSTTPYTNATVVGRPLRAQGSNFFVAKALEGSVSPEVAQYSFRALANYTFKDGPMKGFKTGGSYRWNDDTAIGYGRTSMTFLPGDLDLELNVVDVDNPYYNDARSNVDVWFGYSKKIFKDTARWNVQLNIRNLFADKEPIVVQIQPDGTTVNRVAIPAARQFVLTNTISF